MGPLLALLLGLGVASASGSHHSGGASLEGVAPLPSRLRRAQSLPLEELRQLQAEVAMQDAGPSKAYQDAYLNYLVVTHLKKADPKAGQRLLAQTLQDLEGRGDAESLALRGGCLGLRIGFQPLLAPVLSAKANFLFHQALRSAPGSPRVRWFQAVHTLGSPAFLGGGVKAARPLLEAALVAAEAEPNAADPLAPRWGLTEVLAWLSLAQANTGDRALALTTVRRALALDPAHPTSRNIESQLMKLGPGK